MRGKPAKWCASCCRTWAWVHRRRRSCWSRKPSKWQFELWRGLFIPCIIVHICFSIILRKRSILRSFAALTLRIPNLLVISLPFSIRGYAFISTFPVNVFKPSYLYQFISCFFGSCPKVIFKSLGFGNILCAWSPKAYGKGRLLLFAGLLATWVFFLS